MTACRRPDCPSCWFAWAAEKSFVLRSTDDLVAFANGPFDHPNLKENVAHRVFLVYAYLHLIARGDDGSRRALVSLGWDPERPARTRNRLEHCDGRGATALRPELGAGANAPTAQRSARTARADGRPLMSTVPSWLLGFTGHSARRVQQPRKPHAEHEVPTGFGKEIDEPRAWDFDGDLTRRVEVYDHNFKPPRLVRRCGYQRCLSCREPFWSPDCTRVRLCSPCKTPNTADTRPEVIEQRREYNRQRYLADKEARNR